MLHINDVTYRIEGRMLLNKATAAISEGWKVGFIGRNGTGKSTLLKLIRQEIVPDDGDISIRKNRHLGGVEQEAPASDISLIEMVLSYDKERVALLQEAETTNDPNRIAEVQTRLADIGAYSAEARAAEILAGLGFSAGEQLRACKEFSGGWRMRVALAGVLFSKPDILLLDEPTNYLDLEGAIWLENYLKTYPYTVLIVSHDRDFLNQAVTHIMALEGGKLTISPGDYNTYERRRAESFAQAEAFRTKQDAARKHMESFIERFRAKASKAKQAQSRIKALEKMQTVAGPIHERSIPFHFPSPKPPMAPPIVRVVETDLGYEEGKPVLKNVDLRLDQDNRIAILGPNGMGKSTLVKAISGRLSPMTGNIYKHKKLKIAYFAQHQLDELRPKETPLQHVAQLMPEGTQAQIRSATARLGFGAEKVDTKVENLSGGEKARLLLGLITLEGAHLLILDEPTNHLDISAREALVIALNEYQGAVIMITHDAHLAEAVAEQFWLIKDGHVSVYDGDMDDYRQMIVSAGKTVSTAPRKKNQIADSVKIRRKAAAARQSLDPLKKKSTAAEAKLENLNTILKKLDKALGDPEIYKTNIPRVTKLQKERAALLSAIEEAEEKWLTALEHFENAQKTSVMDAPKT